jgi:flagellar biosynthesis protein FlhF
MSNEKIGATQLEIEGPSREDCEIILRKRYPNGYQVISQSTTLHGGFLGFGQHETIKIGYIVNTKAPQHETNTDEEKASFTRNRDDFLKKADPTVTSNLQMAQIAKKLDIISEEMNEKLETLKEVSAVHGEHPSIKKIQDLLEENEFTKTYIKKISDRLKAEFSLEELEDYEKVQSTVVDWIGEDIHIAKTPVYRPPHVIIIVGPTGVGKTTTVAKMAANIILDAKKRELPRPAVRMMTIDKMRVGATVQLERWGEIMNVTVDNADKSDDVKAIFNDYKSKLDYLLIDTSGFSPNDFENIGKMRAMLEVPGLHPDVYLAVTAGTKAVDLEKILKNYETFNFRSVILTKCDETSTYGNIISVLAECGKELSWITDGQNVPRFIEKATQLWFLKRLVDFTIDKKHVEVKFVQPEEEI